MHRVKFTISQNLNSLSNFASFRAHNERLFFEVLLLLVSQDPRIDRFWHSLRIDMNVVLVGFPLSADDFGHGHSLGCRVYSFFCIHFDRFITIKPKRVKLSDSNKRVVEQFEELFPVILLHKLLGVRITLQQRLRIRNGVEDIGDLFWNTGSQHGDISSLHGQKTGPEKLSCVQSACNGPRFHCKTFCSEARKKTMVYRFLFWPPQSSKQNW